VAQRLAGLRACAPLGINIVSTNRGAASAAQSDEEVIGDYLQSARRLQPFADYPVPTRAKAGAFLTSRRVSLTCSVGSMRWMAAWPKDAKKSQILIGFLLRLLRSFASSAYGCFDLVFRIQGHVRKRPVPH
jgi:hypothetical protein